MRNQKRVSGNQPIVVPTLVPRALATVEIHLKFYSRVLGRSIFDSPQ